MLKRLYVYIQYLLPQHGLSYLIGCLAETRVSWLKNLLIKRFIKSYRVDLSDAEIEDPYAYPTFNRFFIRELKSHLRPIAAGKLTIVSPVDGTIAQLGTINQNRLFQAKHFYFDLRTLLANDLPLAQDFADGRFATFYLAPNNYHRVHMPTSGKLLKTIYVPGKLFSVNKTTADFIPNLYSRNERYISLFETNAGQMIIILVGAMIVGSIQTTWLKQPIRHHEVIIKNMRESILLAKGEELGYFKMGSTVIVLFQKNRVEWGPSLKSNLLVKFGEFLGNICHAG